MSLISSEKCPCGLSMAGEGAIALVWTRRFELDSGRDASGLPASHLSRPKTGHGRSTRSFLLTIFCVFSTSAQSHLEVVAALERAGLAGLALVSCFLVGRV